MAAETPEVSEATTRLLPELLALPRADQEFLFQQLSAALDAEPDEDPEFVAELDRRLDNYRTGRSPGVPADEVFRKLREAGR
jgi:putative addiction module component (TIGR02574 family)